MPDFMLVPESDHLADPDDMTNAVFAFGVQSPAQVTGLANGTTFVAREVLRSPASQPFTPASAGVPAPTAAGGLADQSFIVGEAIAPIDVATDFTGDNITYSLSPTSPAGLTMTSGGIISGTPNAEVSSLPVVVTGTNSGGSADSAFSLTVEAAAPQIQVVDNGDGTAQIVNVPSTGDATYVVTEPTYYAGTYTITQAQIAALATAPLVLVGLAIEGASPDTYRLQYPSHALYTGITPPARSYQWQLDGADIAGQTNPASVPTAGLSGALTLVETTGSVVTTSNAIAVSSGATSNLVSSFFAEPVSADTFTSGNLDLSGGERFVVMLPSYMEGNSTRWATATLAGVAPANSWLAENSNSETVHAWEFTGVSATSGVLDLDTGITAGTAKRLAGSVYQVGAGDTLTTVVTPSSSATSFTTAVTTGAVTAGGKVIVGLAAERSASVMTNVQGLLPAEIDQNELSNFRPLLAGQHDVTASAASLTFSADLGGTTARRTCGIAITVS